MEGPLRNHRNLKGISRFSEECSCALNVFFFNIHVIYLYMY